VGGIRQQFSVAENIKMSQYGAEFLKNVNHYLLVPGEDPIDVNFKEHGYLFLASRKNVHILRENYEVQRNLGAQVLLLEPSEMAKKFPWLKANDLALGCLGIQSEGWFDPWQLLNAFKKKVVSLGVSYLHGTVDSVQVAGKRVKAVNW
jgi:glycine/D-amino acid oxidase-like deaminating enzyme